MFEYTGEIGNTGEIGPTGPTGNYVGYYNSMEIIPVMYTTSQYGFELLTNNKSDDNHDGFMVANQDPYDDWKFSFDALNKPYLFIKLPLSKGLKLLSFLDS